MRAADTAGSSFRDNRIHVRADLTTQASWGRENIWIERTCNTE